MRKARAVMNEEDHGTARKRDGKELDGRAAGGGHSEPNGKRQRHVKLQEEMVAGNR